MDFLHLFIFVILACVANGAVLTAPVLILGPVRQHSSASAVDPNDLTCLAKSALTQDCDNGISKDTLTTRKVDVVVAYFIPKMDTSDLHPSEWPTSQPTAFFPFGITKSPTGVILKDELASLALKSIKVINFNEFKVSMDGSTRLVIVKANSIVDAQALYTEIEEWFDSKKQHATRMSIVSASSTRTSHAGKLAPRIKLMANIHRRHLLATANATNESIVYTCSFVNTTSNNVTITGVPCTTPEGLFGFLLVGFLLLPLFFTGACCLGAVDTPLRVPSRVFPVRKEF